MPRLLDHACPFNDGAGLIRYLRGNMRRGKDTMLSCEGPEGSGKSTTSGQLCRRLDPGFDLVEDTIFTLGHLLDVMEDARKHQVYNVDEAINIFHNQDWATWQLKALTKIIRQMRIMQSTWVLNVPDFEGLHPYLRDHRIRLRFYHRPLFDADGMGNGPPIMLWKNERFDFREQRVTTYWTDLEADLHIESMDHDPRHQEYVEKKEANFRDLVVAMKHRLGLEQEEAAPAAKRVPRKRAKNASPPTTT